MQKYLQARLHFTVHCYDSEKIVLLKTEGDRYSDIYQRESHL